MSLYDFTLPALDGLPQALAVEIQHAPPAAVVSMK